MFLFFGKSKQKKIHKSTRILLNFSQSLPLTCNYLSLSVSIKISVSFTICFYLFLYVCLCCLKLILCLSICSPFNFANWQQTYKIYYNYFDSLKIVFVFDHSKPTANQYLYTYTNILYIQSSAN